MFNVKSLIFTILSSLLICNFTYGDDNCEIQSTYNAKKLAGKWQYIASVTEVPHEVRCGEISLRKIFPEILGGFRFSFHGLEKKNLTIQARVFDNSFELRFRRVKGYSPLISMSIVSCDIDKEFALEFPTRKMYFIFSRTSSVSSKFFHRYEQLAIKHSLKLQMMNNNDCNNKTIQN
ncbi:hypothetical protein PV327_007589 [Microctonus hyperodae]|uniref:Uncharacterized protein n=1 Tax=Microctonus hyperodae TaxID=165561 RepID=A0AA39G070_MICHY|nr:hypothetical protein PV327_007589 [Microctonus hyperodae]